MKNIFDSKQFIFQISSPRSGSTFMANLINSFQNTCLINEPFTRKYIFNSAEKDFEKEILRLINNYTFYRLKSKNLRFLFSLIVKFLNRIFSFFGFKKTFFKKVYHINSLNQSLFRPTYYTSHRKEQIDIIHLKCIRVKTAVDFILNCDIRNYQVIHLIRHPLEFIDSTIKQRNLDLKTNIISNFDDYMKGFPDDHEFIKKFYVPNCAVTQLAINWVLINNYCYNFLNGKDIYSNVFYNELVEFDEFSIHELINYNLTKQKNNNKTKKILIKNKNPRNIFKKINYSFNDNLIDKFSSYKLDDIFSYSVFEKNLLIIKNIK